MSPPTDPIGLSIPPVQGGIMGAPTATNGLLFSSPFAKSPLFSRGAAGLMKGHQGAMTALSKEKKRS